MERNSSNRIGGADSRDVLERMRRQADADNVRVTQHALEEMADENITLGEIYEAIAAGEILENYPEHRRGPCCLLSGVTQKGRFLHVVCTSARPELIIITAYEPQPPKWLTPTKRRG